MLCAVGPMPYLRRKHSPLVSWICTHSQLVCIHSPWSNTQVDHSYKFHIHTTGKFAFAIWQSPVRQSPISRAHSSPRDDQTSHLPSLPAPHTCTYSPPIAASPEAEEEEEEERRCPRSADCARAGRCRPPSRGTTSTNPASAAAPTTARSARTRCVSRHGSRRRARRAGRRSGRSRRC